MISVLRGLLLETIHVLEQRPTHRAIGGLQHHQRHVARPCGPALLQSLPALGIDLDVDGSRALGDMARAYRNCSQHASVDIADQDEDVMVCREAARVAPVHRGTAGPRRRRSGGGWSREGAPASGMSRITSHAPCVNLVVAMTSATMPVVTAPAPFSTARIGQRGPCSRNQKRTIPSWESVKRDEDADGIERDQRVRLGVEDHEQKGAQDRQDDDAVGEGRVGPPARELARHEPVASHERRQPGKSRRSWCSPR